MGGSRGAASVVESFVENAYLGSERARQALGHILAAVGEPDGAPVVGALPQHCGLDDLLMSRIRVERPSYNQTLTKPLARRLEKNPAVEQQATDRAYRIGQTRPVSVHTLTVTSPAGRTVEQVLHDLLSEKRRLMADFVVPLGGFDLSPEQILAAAGAAPPRGG